MTLKQIKDALSGKNPTVRSEDYEGSDRRLQERVAAMLLPRLLAALGTVCALLLAVAVWQFKGLIAESRSTHDAVIEIKDGAKSDQDKIHNLELQGAQIEGDLAGHEKRIIFLEATKRQDNGR